MQAERPGRLELARGHGLDAGAEDLGGVGRRHQGDGRGRGGERRQPEPDEGQGVVDDDQQHQERDGAEDVDIGDRDQPRSQRRP